MSPTEVYVALAITAVVSSIAGCGIGIWAAHVRANIPATLPPTPMDRTFDRFAAENRHQREQIHAAGLRNSIK